MTITANTGKPPELYSNRQWQQDFNKLKEDVFVANNENTTNNIDSLLDEYSYNSFISDVLAEIRAGEIDYCFYIYQIAELLKYEPQNLRAVYDKRNECFLVWIYK